MKKILTGILVTLVAICVVLILMVNSWMDTGYGRLNYKAAIALKMADLMVGKDEFSLEKSRQEQTRLAEKLTGDQVPVDSVINRLVPGPAGDIPVRIYHPNRSKILPVIIFYHGGGWVQGNLDTFDNLVRYLAVKTKAVAVSVEYRLAPEHPFPAGIEDAYAVLTWIADNAELIGGDPANIAVMGDSAGGNLSAAVSLLARNNNGPEIARQVLFYPATNLKSLDTESYIQLGRYRPTREKVIWLRDQYLPRQSDWANPLASPLLAEDHRSLPPATIITAEIDPLKDDGKLYAEKLKNAGVAVNYHCYQGMIHGFASADRLFSQAREALNEAAADLRRSFGTSP